MAITFALNPTFGTDHSLNNLAAKRFKMVTGEFTYATSASCSALTVTTAMVGLNDIRGFFAMPKGNAMSWLFDPATDTIRPNIGFIASVTTTAVQYFTCTASFVVAVEIASVPFICIGFE